MTLNGFQSISRAGGSKTTMTADPRAEQETIGFDKHDEQRAGDLGQNRKKAQQRERNIHNKIGLVGH
jgi:hypothetical protein